MNRLQTLLSKSTCATTAWGVLERVLERHEHRFNKSDRGMRAVKVGRCRFTPG